MKTNVVMMAFGRGAVSTEGFSVDRYVGVAPVTVVGFNPTKEELEKIYNTTLDNAPEYFGVQDGNNGEKVPYARISFLVKPNPEKTGMDISPINVSLFVRKEYKFNRDQTKIQVIDEYGNTGWATKEECQNHTQLMSKAGKPLKISTNYRPAYNGEAELTEFMKCFLNIPEAFEYVDGTWRLKKDAELGIARFDTLDKLFSGNFAEIKEILTYQPDNKVKILFGVKKNDEGKMFQDFYRNMFLKNSVTDYSKLDADVQSRKSAGAYPNTDFIVGDFKVYEVNATNLNTAPANDPFGQPAPAAANPWFNA